MQGKCIIRGRVACAPAVTGDAVSFLLQTKHGAVRVLRKDPAWQRRDVIFLRPGQTVEVTGVRQSPERILARRILITHTGRNLESEER